MLRFTENFGIRYYGMAYALGFFAALALLRLYWRSGKSPLNPTLQSKLITCCAIGVLVGGRFGYFLLYTPRALISDPLSLFRVWDGGMASHGGFAGVLIAFIWFIRKSHLPWRRVADILVTLAPPGLFFGRVANFINGELWGKISFVPWAVIFQKSAAMGTPISGIPPRHPSQIYEALLEGLLLTIYTQIRFWKSDVRENQPGQLTGEFLACYATARAIGESFREPDASLLFGVSRGTFYSVFLFLAGLALIWHSRKRQTVP